MTSNENHNPNFVLLNFQVFCKTRSVDVPLTVFHYALLSGNTSLIRSLSTELSKLGSFMNTTEEDAPRMLKDSGDAQ